MLNQLKGIKSGLKEVSIRIINDSLNDVQNQLSNYKYIHEIDSTKEYNIYKLCKLIQSTDIYDLSFNELEIYVGKLISIVEFIEL